jgi:hypothetical protein
MISVRRHPIWIFVALASVSQAQPNVTGRWIGHKEIDIRKMPVPKDAAERRVQDARTALTKTVVFRMDLLKDGKYRMVTSVKGQPDQLDEGTWILVGERLDRTLQRSNGKPNGPFTAHYLVEKGGTRLVGIPTIDKFARTIFVRP